ncbi:MAG: PglZ domain-containing protein [Myxococcales bacterium]|nr:PglZ domain-containing protein [Myxococcales bacterium]
MLVTACASARKDVGAASEARAHVALFVKHAREIDGAHLEIRYAAEEAGLPAVAKVADRAYAAYTNTLNEAFFKQVAETKSLDGLGLPGVTQQLEKSVWKAHGRRAVVIVDALRYDCAVAIGERLRGQNVEVTPVLAVLPTVTPVGMTAMLPLSGTTVDVELKQNSLHPKVGGKDFAARAARLAFLTEFGADCRDISEVELGLHRCPHHHRPRVHPARRAEAPGRGQLRQVVVPRPEGTLRPRARERRPPARDAALRVGPGGAGGGAAGPGLLQG